ncbi:thioredoxin family protein [Candidatus Zixiibacteriota bacterium]
MRPEPDQSTQSGGPSGKLARTWLAVTAAAVLLSIIGLIIIIDTGREKSTLTVDGEAAEVSILTGSEIPALLANGRFSMIEFGGRSCTPCKQMQPILIELINEYGSSIDIVNVYLDEDFAPADSFDVYLLPTQVIFSREGVELSRHLGKWPKPEIEEEYRRLGIIR